MIMNTEEKHEHAWIVAKQVVARYRRAGVMDSQDVGDFLSVAWLAAMQSDNSFDPDKGSWDTHAYTFARAAVSRELRKRALVRPAERYQWYSAEAMPRPVFVRIGSEFERGAGVLALGEMEAKLYSAGLAHWQDHPEHSALVEACKEVAQAKQRWLEILDCWLAGDTLSDLAQTWGVTRQACSLEAGRFVLAIAERLRELGILHLYAPKRKRGHRGYRWTQPKRRKKR